MITVKRQQRLKDKNKPNVKNANVQQKENKKNLSLPKGFRSGIMKDKIIIKHGFTPDKS